MTKSERQRQKKLAKRQKRSNEVRKMARIHRNPSTRDLILQSLGNKWEISFKRESQGMASVVAMRRMKVGNPLSVCFLIDSYCLGVKDAYFSRDMDIERVREMIREGGDEVTIVSPEYILKFVRQAIEYARGIGLEPARDAELCLLMFSDVDASLCHDEFVFGKDGKPLFVSGPNDPPERIARILKTLGNLGKDHFHYAVQFLGAGNGDILRLDDHELFEGRLGREEWDEDEADEEEFDDEDERGIDSGTMDATDFKRVN